MTRGAEENVSVTLTSEEHCMFKLRPCRDCELAALGQTEPLTSFQTVADKFGDFFFLKKKSLQTTTCLKTEHVPQNTALSTTLQEKKR